MVGERQTAKGDMAKQRGTSQNPASTRMQPLDSRRKISKFAMSLWDGGVRLRSLQLATVAYHPRFPNQKSEVATCGSSCHSSAQLERAQMFGNPPPATARPTAQRPPTVRPPPPPRPRLRSPGPLFAWSACTSASPRRLSELWRCRGCRRCRWSYRLQARVRCVRVRTACLPVCLVIFDKRIQFPTRASMHAATILSVDNSSNMLAAQTDSKCGMKSTLNLA